MANWAEGRFIARADRPHSGPAPDHKGVVGVGPFACSAHGRRKGGTARKIESPEVRATLAQALEEFWEGYTGVRPEYARVVVGDEVVAVWLSGVLSPGEPQVAGTRTGREMLEEVGERILEQAKPQLLHLVEGSFAREATLIDVHLDVANGYLVGFFSLE
ncbi:MAG: Na-translocating system protein MpsC family protein [Anaerolineae bacterium]